MAVVLPGGDDGLYKQSGVGYKEGDFKFMRNVERLIPFYRTNFYRLDLLSTKLRGDQISRWLIGEENQN